MLAPFDDQDGMTLYEGDCRDVLRTLDAASVDACVTDPPYGLEFMGKEWDKLDGEPNHWNERTQASRTGQDKGDFSWFGGAPKPRYEKNTKAMQAWHEAWACEVYRALKPGGFLLSFGGTRTFHRMTVAIEDAGFEIKDCLCWLHGQGFPKHKSLLKPAWEPVIVAKKPGAGGLHIEACRLPLNGESPPSGSGDRRNGLIYAQDEWTRRHMANGGNTTPESGRWPPNVALDETAAALLDEMSGARMHGAGSARNALREAGKTGMFGFAGDGHRYGDSGGASRFMYVAKASRRERNIGLDSTYTVKYNVEDRGGPDLCAATVRLLEKATSDIPTVKWLTAESGASIMALCPRDSLSTTLTAIRQITTSRTSPLLPPSPISVSTQGVNSETANGGSPVESAGYSSRSMPNITSDHPALAPGAVNAALTMLSLISDAAAWKPLTNIHSTVKPLALMRWLVRLVCPPGGVVLDPFMGSGTTGAACALEGMRFVGIEADAEYLAIAERRIAYWAAQRPTTAQVGLPLELVS